MKSDGRTTWKYERTGRLDHPRVIQIAARCVKLDMQHMAAPWLSLPGMRAASTLWLGPLSPMPTEKDDTPARSQWAHLILAIAAHQDLVAFESLYSYFALRIKTFMQRSGSNEARAEELAQEAMLAVWRKAALFDPKAASASTWIFTIARNLRIDAFRRERRGVMTEASDIEIEFQVDDSPLPDATLEASQSESRIRAALAKLTDEQFRVVELSFFEEKAHGEIARILGIPLGTVKSRLRLAMTKLRTLLSELS